MKTSPCCTKVQRHLRIVNNLRRVAISCKNNVSLEVYYAIGNLTRQGERGGHKVGKMGQRCLWVVPLLFTFTPFEIGLEIKKMF